MKYSKNLLTNEKYALPSSSDDREAIEKFLALNRNKKIVVVQGLGFVGAVMSLVCANALHEDYAVIGVDLASEASYWKIKSLNDGIFPLSSSDPQIEELFEKSKLKNNFLATFDSLAYSFADVIIVDVNLDVQKQSGRIRDLKDFDVDLDGFKSAIQDIGENCKENALILVETTVPPGTCDRIVRPLIQESFKERGLQIDKFRLGHSYERVMPGPDYVDSIRNFPRVYSGCDEASADAVEGFLGTIIDTSQCELTRLEHTNATEMAKVLENSYRAMNIAFMVEWSRFAEEAGVNLYDMVNAIRVRKTHSNLMYPGIGVGGYCLTKDPLLASWSRMSIFGSDAQLEMSVRSVSINDQMPVYAFKRLKRVFGSLSNKKLAVMGVSYRGDVGDTRFSPVEFFANQLREEGAHLNFHDPYVSYWPELDCDVEVKLENVLYSECDIIVLAAGHSVYKSSHFMEILMQVPPKFIFDTIGLLSIDHIKLLGQKHQVTVLGRGDI